MPSSKTKTKHNLPKTNGAFIRRVAIRNYRNIEFCSVALKRTTVLVGRNGAGKSNFLDALRFVKDGLDSSLDQAVRSRGGISEIRMRGTGRPRNISIRLHLNLRAGIDAEYSFEIVARTGSGYIVKNETLSIRDKRTGKQTGYEVHEGKVSGRMMPPAKPDRLYLVTASSLAQFRPVYDALTAMAYYNFNADEMRKLQPYDAAAVLARDGHNIAGVISRMSGAGSTAMQRVNQYLGAIVPGVVHVSRVSLGQYETLEFEQHSSDNGSPWRFHALSMSDGTLRALGALVAVNQLADGQRTMNAVGIEEPETALHPAAAGALMDALRDAASRTQVIITTHSPDLLDHVRPDHDRLLVVTNDAGASRIERLSEARKKLLDDLLYTPGELLRMDQLAAGSERSDRRKAGTRKPKKGR